MFNIEKFGFYFFRKNYDVDNDIDNDTNDEISLYPNYYIGWMKDVGIIYKGKPYIPNFMIHIGGPNHGKT